MISKIDCLPTGKSITCMYINLSVIVLHYFSINSTIPHGQLRMRVKAVANFERTNNGIWSIKAVGEDDFPGVEALGRKVSSGTII